MSIKVAVIGASGNVGSAVVKELITRGKYDITAVARHTDKIPTGSGVTVVTGDASKPEELISKIKGVEVVISALHFDVPAATIVDEAKQAGAKRLIAVGGAASLKVSEDGPIVFDTPEFPKEYVEIARPGVQYLKDLREISDFDWTFFSPPLEIGPGDRTGKFRLGGDILLTDKDGKSAISYDDYAIALVDELEKHNVSKARFTAAY